MLAGASKRLWILFDKRMADDGEQKEGQRPAADNATPSAAQL